MKLKSKFFSWGLPLLALFMLLFAIKEAFTHHERKPAMPPFPPPTTQLHNRIAALGVVEPCSEFIDVGTYIAGTVVELHVKAGQKVKKGDLLFVIETRDTQAALETAKAAVAAAEVALENAKIQFAFYDTIEDKKAIPIEDLELRRLAVQIAQAALIQAKAAAHQLEVTLDLLHVRAPIDGEILRVNIHLGEYATSIVFGSNGTPLIIMGDTSRLYVRAEIDETDVQRLDKSIIGYGALRSDSSKTVPLTYEWNEGGLTPKTSLSGDGNERVDTRVLQILYSFPNDTLGAYCGQQMDIFIDAPPPAPHRG